MAKTQKRAAPARAAPLHIPMKLASLATTDTAPNLSRQGAPAAWIARRFGLPPATAAAVAQLAGIGASL